MNVINEEKWLNKTNNIAIPPLYGKDRIATNIKISKSRIGSKRSIESRIKQSKSISGENNPFFKKTHSIEFSKKQSLRQKIKQKGGTNSNAIAVSYNGIIYETIKEMMLATGLSYYKINKMIDALKIKKV